jgi:hypothetical protein
MITCSRLRLLLFVLACLRSHVQEVNAGGPLGKYPTKLTERAELLMEGQLMLFILTRLESSTNAIVSKTPVQTDGIRGVKM